MYLMSDTGTTTLHTDASDYEARGYFKQVIALTNQMLLFLNLSQALNYAGLSHKMKRMVIDLWYGF